MVRQIRSCATSEREAQSNELLSRLLVYLFTCLLVYSSTRFQKAGDAQYAAGIDQTLGEDPEDAVVNRAHRGQEQAHQGEGHAGGEQRDGGDFL